MTLEAGAFTPGQGLAQLLGPWDEAQARGRLIIMVYLDRREPLLPRHVGLNAGFLSSVVST